MTSACLCSDWGERVRIPLGAATADLLEAFDDVRERNPWLRLARCRGCGRPWYVAVDTVDDDYYFRRLSTPEADAAAERDEWPTDFDGFVNVWPLGAEHDHEARRHWPWKGEPFEVRSLAG